MLHGEVQGIAGVVNILQDQHMAALDVGGQVLAHQHFAVGAGALVGGNAHEVDPAGNVDGPHQVSHEHKAALQYTDKDRALSLIITGNGFAQFLDLSLNFIVVIKYSFNVIMNTHIIHHFSLFLLLEPSEFYLQFQPHISVRSQNRRPQ